MIITRRLVSKVAGTVQELSSQIVLLSRLVVLSMVMVNVVSVPVQGVYGFMIAIPPKHGKSVVVVR